MEERNRRRCTFQCFPKELSSPNFRKTDFLFRKQKKQLLTQNWTETLKLAESRISEPGNLVVLRNTLKTATVSQDVPTKGFRPFFKGRKETFFCKAAFKAFCSRQTNLTWHFCLSRNLSLHRGFWRFPKVLAFFDFKQQILLLMQKCCPAVCVLPCFCFLCLHLQFLTLFSLVIHTFFSCS